VIPNGVEPPRVELLPMPQRRKVFVAAGRLVEQKGFDLLIEAFARIAERHPDWSLEIYGTGPLEGELRDQLTRAGLESRVVLAGWADDFNAVLARSSVFVLSSRYEGFPNALLDAMAHGCACVGFSCESGPEEIIEHEENGLLVEAESVSELADQMSIVAGDVELRTQLGGAAMRVSERFSHSQFISAWDELIAALAHRRN